MDGVKAFLTRQLGPFPVYAYGVGLVALGLGYLYFTRHNTGQATVAPQTNYPANEDQLPYPFPGGGEIQPAQNPVPPSAVFDTSSAASGPTQGLGAPSGTGPASPPLATSQPTSNFVPPPSEPTTSQTFGASVQQTPATVSPQPSDVPAIAAMVPVPNATYSVPVASTSYVPSGETGLLAGPIQGATQPAPSPVRQAITGMGGVFRSIAAIVNRPPPAARPVQNVSAPSSAPARRGGPLAF